MPCEFVFAVRNGHEMLPVLLRDALKKIEGKAPYSGIRRSCFSKELYKREVPSISYFTDQPSALPQVWPKAHHPHAILGEAWRDDRWDDRWDDRGLAGPGEPRELGSSLGKLHVKHQHQEEDIQKEAVPECRVQVVQCPEVSSTSNLSEKAVG